MAENQYEKGILIVWGKFHVTTRRKIFTNDIRQYNSDNHIITDSCFLNQLQKALLKINYGCLYKSFIFFSLNVGLYHLIVSYHHHITNSCSTSNYSFFSFLGIYRNIPSLIVPPNQG